MFFRSSIIVQVANTGFQCFVTAQAKHDKMSPKMEVPVRGITSQPSVSMQLMRADTVPRGSHVWVEDDKLVWVLAEVVRQENTILTVREMSSGRQRDVDLVRVLIGIYDW